MSGQSQQGKVSQVEAGKVKYLVSCTLHAQSPTFQLHLLLKTVCCSIGGVSFSGRKVLFSPQLRVVMHEPHFYRYSSGPVFFTGPGAALAKK